MTERLILMKKLLKETGSIYYHCDQTASHYVKVIMDGIFGRDNFQNQVIWCYSGTGSKKRWGRKHDTLLFYSGSKEFYFKPLLRGKGEKEKHFNKKDENGRRYWQWSADRRVYWDEYKGRGTHDWWIEIPSLGTRNNAKEYRHYKTQKPMDLLNRIIEASCPKRGVVLDPFCGCGTACESAEHLGRKWVGIDVSIYAVEEIKERLNEIGVKEGDSYQFEVDHPTSWSEYNSLSPYEKQDFLIKAVGGHPNPRKSGDGGVDGELSIHLGGVKGEDKWGKVVFSVKTGNQASPSHIRELKGLLSNVGYEMGILILEKDPTENMEDLARKAGELKYYKNDDLPADVYDRIQILTAGDILLSEQKFNRPPTLQEVKHIREYKQRNLI